MKLSKNILPQLVGKEVVVPKEQQLNFPEKVLQFGTGVLLRGLPDYFIDKANYQGLFNGRVVVIKSISSGGTDAFAEQDGLYTHIIKGIDNGAVVNETIINSSISRVLSASSEWPTILELAKSSDIKLVVSNTTEVGISLVPEDSVDAHPPVSFPGKLLAFLYERFKFFSGDPTKGLVIIPTELIVDNGIKLREIVSELARNNGLDTLFLEWLHRSNDFCNSLVDRIVPGKLPSPELEETEKALGYADDLMIMSECYSLWAIEASNPETVEFLKPLAQADKGLVVVPKINKFRELKLRILNGSHTFTCGLALIAGFQTVKEAMENTTFNQFITALAKDCISPALVGGDITLDDAHDFSDKVLDRYRNPSLAHQWISISVQYSSKMRMRNVPTILASYKLLGSVPKHFAIGFAGYIILMKVNKQGNGNYTGLLNGHTYSIQDDQAATLSQLWESNKLDTITHAVLSNTGLWGTDLTILDGFEAQVSNALNILSEKGFFGVV